MTAAPAPVPVADLDAVHLKQLNRSLHRVRWVVVALVSVITAGAITLLTVQDIQQGNALRADCPLLHAVIDSREVPAPIRSGAVRAYVAHGCAPALTSSSRTAPG